MRGTCVHEAPGYFSAPTQSEAATARPERHDVMTKCTFCKERVDEGLAQGLTSGRGSRRHAHVLGRLHRQRDHLRRSRRSGERRCRSSWPKARPQPLMPECGTQPNVFYVVD